MTPDGCSLPRMILPTRAPRIGKTVPAIVCVLGVCLAITATALAASVIHFESESLSALEGQLHGGQVHALSFHPGTGTGHIHVSLNDHRHMTVAYATSEQAHLIALASAAGTPVVIAQVKPKAVAKTVHHKLRYI